MTRFIFLTILTLFLISACSHTGGISPEIQQANAPKPIDSGVVMISDVSSDGAPSAGMGVMGMFHCIIDVNTMTANIKSLRQTSLVDTLEVVDITNFLRMAPCTDCVNLRGISLNDDSNIVVEIGIKHPFEEGDPFKPITGRNRGDLHVFNVEGTIVLKTEDSHVFPALGSTIASAGLVNADGYTPYLNPVLQQVFSTDANIHPYKLHFECFNKTCGLISMTPPA